MDEGGREDFPCRHCECVLVKCECLKILVRSSYECVAVAVEECWLGICCWYGFMVITTAVTITGCSAPL